MRAMRRSRSSSGWEGADPPRHPAARVVSWATAVASYSALPELMLARSGRLPTSGDYAYEVKWGDDSLVVQPKGRTRCLLDQHRSQGPALTLKTKLRGTCVDRCAVAN
jgi:hypothetical protein